MEISWQLFRFPFDDERWPSKAVVGGLLSLLAMVIWPLYLPLMGFGLRVMRQTVKGEAPSLPEWDNWGELFGDGVRFVVVGLVYAVPSVVVICCAVAFWVLSVLPVVGAAALAEQAQAPGLAVVGVGGTFVAYGIAFVLTAVGSLLGLFTGFLSLIAQTRWVASGSLSSAFEFSEVWRLVQAGFSNYLLAFAIWYGGVFVVSMVASVLFYTIILACLYPFAIGLAMVYSVLLMGALYGMAYYHTQAALPAEGEPKPA